VVSFIDNGPGLSDAGRASLADGAPIPPLGPGLSGLGLWLSARIAEQHGGKLEAGDGAAGTTITLRVRAAAQP